MYYQSGVVLSYFIAKRYSATTIAAYFFLIILLFKTSVFSSYIIVTEVVLRALDEMNKETKMDALVLDESGDQSSILLTNNRGY